MRVERALLSLAILASAATAAQAAPGAGVANILNGTPWWVYALFIVLVASGIQALRPRSWPLARVAAAPLAFTAWGVVSLLQVPSLDTSLILTWLVTAGAGSSVALIAWRSDRIRIDRATRRVFLPGSWAPLARYLVIFTAKYALAVAAALDPAAHGNLVLLDIAVSGLAAGYFLGWLGRLALVYWAPPGSGSQHSDHGESAPVDADQGPARLLSRQIETGAVMQEQITQMFRSDVSLFGRSLP